jgi:hypothetical protein
MSRPAYAIEKHWDENTREREGRNGRIYTSRGRWQWIVVVGGTVDDRAYDSKRAARERLAELRGRRGGEHRRASTHGRTERRTEP